MGFTVLLFVGRLKLKIVVSWISNTDLLNKICSWLFLSVTFISVVMQQWLRLVKWVKYNLTQHLLFIWRCNPVFKTALVVTTAYWSYAKASISFDDVFKNHFNSSVLFAVFVSHQLYVSKVRKISKNALICKHDMCISRWSIIHIIFCEIVKLKWSIKMTTYLFCRIIIFTSKGLRTPDK